MKLRLYQSNKIRDLEEQWRAYLLADVGAGKTVIALTAALHLINKARPFLVIAPQLVAETVWHTEAAKWPHLSKLKIVVLAGRSPKRRLEMLTLDADIYVINYELMPWLAKNVNLCEFFHGVILDEISRLKTPNKLRWRTVLKLADSASVVWGLTGTPISTSLLNLFGQFRMIDHGKALGRYITHYKMDYFYQCDRQGFVWAIRHGAEKRIYERIKPLVVRVSKAEQARAEPVYINIIDVHLCAEARKQYQQLHRDFVLSLEEDTVIVAENAAVLTGKLTQFTGGGLYDENHEYKVLSKAKYNALDELLLSLEGQPVLLVYAYQGEAKKIRTRYPSARWLGHETDTKAQLIDQWNKHEIDDMILLIHPSSAGHGVNLQFGGHHLVFFGGTWSQEMYRQVVGRLVRPGQTRPVIVHHLICTHTVDTIQYAVMRGRMKDQENLVNALT